MLTFHYLWIIFVDRSCRAYWTLYQLSITAFNLFYLALSHSLQTVAWTSTNNAPPWYPTTANQTWNTSVKSTAVTSQPWWRLTTQRVPWWWTCAYERSNQEVSLGQGICGEGLWLILAYNTGCMFFFCLNSAILVHFHDLVFKYGVAQDNSYDVKIWFCYKGIYWMNPKKQNSDNARLRWQQLRGLFESCNDFILKLNHSIKINFSHCFHGVSFFIYLNILYSGTFQLTQCGPFKNVI